MNVTGRVWLELTQAERMVCIRFAVEENAKRQRAKGMKKAAQAG